MTEDEMVGWHHQLNGLSLRKLQEIVKDREAWHAACSPWGCHTGPERACTPSLCDTGHLEPHGLCRCLPTPLLELGSLQRGPSSSTDSGQTGLHLTLCHPAVAALLD